MTASRIFVEEHAERVAYVLDESWVDHIQVGRWIETEQVVGSVFAEDEPLSITTWCKFGGGAIRTSVQVSRELMPRLLDGDPNVLRWVREDLRETTWRHGQYAIDSANRHAQTEQPTKEIK